MNRFVAGSVLPLLLLVASCTATGGGRPAGRTAAASAPFADCATLTTAPTVSPAGSAPAASPATTAPGDGAGSGEQLPDLELPCFTGDSPVRLSDVRGPAVINLWGSWCAPCRRELPAFQRLAQRAGGVRVIGVDTRDDREAAASLAEDLGLTFPTLYDPDERLRSRLRAAGLPVTLFVDAAGRVRHLDNTGALDDQALGSLVERHLGVPA